MKRIFNAAAAFLARWLDPYQALWLTLFIGGALTVVLAKLSAEVYESVVEEDGISGVDKPLLNWVKQFRSPAVNAAMTVFTDIGSAYVMPAVALAAAIVLALWSRNWRPLILVVAAGSGSLLATVLGKQIFGRARPHLADAVPPYESSPSFPSGHTLNATVVVGVLVYLLCLQFHRTSARIAAVAVGGLFVVAMGLSRVFLGHHWFTDVLAAWLLGLAWLCLVILAHRLFHVVRQRRHGAVRKGTEPGSVPDGG